MKVAINTKGNGACPLCDFNARCVIQTAIANALDELNDSHGEGMEMVIYICPRFREH